MKNKKKQINNINSKCKYLRMSDLHRNWQCKNKTRRTKQKLEKVKIKWKRMKRTSRKTRIKPDKKILYQNLIKRKRRNKRKRLTKLLKIWQTWISRVAFSPFQRLIGDQNNRSKNSLKTKTKKSDNKYNTSRQFKNKLEKSNKNRSLMKQTSK